MLEAVESELRLLEALEAPGAMRRVRLSILETVEGGLCLLELLGMLEVMRCVLLRIPEAVKGGLCLLEVLERVVVEEWSSGGLMKVCGRGVASRVLEL